MTHLDLPAEAEHLIPHRPPMRMVDRLVAFAGDTGTVTAHVGPDHLLLAPDGTLDEAGLVELLAQAYAAIQGYVDRLSGQGVRQGFLVGGRDIVVTGTARQGDDLQIELTTVARLDGVALAQGEVRRGEEVLASGTIKLWIAPDSGGGATA